MIILDPHTRLGDRPTKDNTPATVTIASDLDGGGNIKLGQVEWSLSSAPTAPTLLSIALEEKDHPGRVWIAKEFYVTKPGLDCFTFNPPTVVPRSYNIVVTLSAAGKGVYGSIAASA